MEEVVPEVLEKDAGGGRFAELDHNVSRMQVGVYEIVEKEHILSRVSERVERRNDTETHKERVQTDGGDLVIIRTTSFAQEQFKRKSVLKLFNKHIGRRPEFERSGEGYWNLSGSKVLFKRQ